MKPDIAEVLGPRPKPPKIIRVLWRMQGPTRAIVARIERHPFGRELAMAFADGDDVIQSRSERANFAVMEQRARRRAAGAGAEGWTALITMGPVMTTALLPRPSDRAGAATDLC